MSQGKRIGGAVAWRLVTTRSSFAVEKYEAFRQVVVDIPARGIVEAREIVEARAGLRPMGLAALRLRIGSNEPKVDFVDRFRRHPVDPGGLLVGKRAQPTTAPART